LLKSNLAFSCIRYRRIHIIRKPFKNNIPILLKTSKNPNVIFERFQIKKVVDNILNIGCLYFLVTNVATSK